MRKTGLFDYLFKGRKNKEIIGEYFKLLNGYSPVFSTYDGGVYEMDLTRTAINSFATHCSKLKPEVEGSALKNLERTLQFKPTAAELRNNRISKASFFALYVWERGACGY